MPKRKSSPKSKASKMSPENDDTSTQVSFTTTVDEPEPAEKGAVKDTPVVKIKKKYKRKQTHQKTPSSYLLFSMEHRKTVIEGNPELTLGEVSKKCGEAWALLDESTKGKWKAHADELKQEAIENAPPPKPKKRPSSYLMFAMEHRKKVISEFPELSLGDVSKKCGHAWRELSVDEKEQWKSKTLQ